MTNMGTQYGDVLPKCDAMQVAGTINRMAIDHHLESVTVIHKLFGTGVVIDISSSEQRENCSGHCMTVELQFGAPTRLRGFVHITWVWRQRTCVQKAKIPPLKFRVSLKMY